MAEMAGAGMCDPWRRARGGREWPQGLWIGRTGVFSTLVAGVPQAACYATAARPLLTSESQLWHAANRPPWFQFVYSPDGCELLACECQFFRDRAIAAGFSAPPQAGGAGMGAKASGAGRLLPGFPPSRRIAKGETL